MADNRVKKLESTQNAKFDRESYKRDSHKILSNDDGLIVYGKQVCLYVLENHSHLIREIYFGKEIERDLFAKFSKLNKPIIKPDNKRLQALSKGGNHQGFLLKLSDNVKFDFKFLQGCSKIVVIVGVTDVGNIGSIFRSALCLGVDCIVCTNGFDKSGVARVSSGAFFDMPFVIYKDYLSLINELKMGGFGLFGSDMKGIAIHKVKEIPSKWALFLGSEGEGLPNRVIKKMDSTLCVEMQNFDSLNVSVAAGILIYGMVKNGK